MKVESIALGELAIDPKNSRKHDKASLEGIKASLERFGQQRPILVREGGAVIAGNGTLAAAKALGWKTIDVVFTDLEDDAARAFAIADNRIAELSEWDFEVLSGTLEDVAEFHDVLGFSDGDIENITAADFDLGDEVKEGDIDGHERSGTKKKDPGSMVFLNEAQLAAVVSALEIERKVDEKATLGAFLAHLAQQYSAAKGAKDE